MSVDRDVTRIVRSWLKSDEHESADRVLDAVLDRLDATPQRRARTWPVRRFTSMHAAMRFAVAAAVVVAVGIGAYMLAGGPSVGSPPGPATPMPSAAGPTTFTSERHGYSLTLPGPEWHVTEFPGTWRTSGTFVEDSPGVDSVARDEGVGDPFILFVSGTVAPETTLDGWVLAYNAANATAFPECPLASTEPGELDGEPAQYRRYVCDDNGRAGELVALHEDRAYVVRVFGPSSPQWDPRPILDEWAGRFSFTR